MKLKNFMFATMIACAFASCSEDDVIDNGTGPVTKGDASLTIETILGASTKADAVDENALTGEDQINDIQVAIYNGNTLVAKGVSDVNIKNKVNFVGLPSGTPLTCIVLANMPANTIDGLTPAALTKSLSIPAGGFSQSSIPMYGTSASFTLTAGETREIPVTVYRNVARVQLSGIELMMGHANSDFISGKATFNFTNLYVNDVASTGNVTGASNATVFVDGADAYSNNDVNTLYDWNTTHSNAVINATVVQEYINGAWPEAKLNVLGVDDAIKYYFYVFANANRESDAHATVLTIAGTFSMENGVLKDNGGTVNIVSQPSYYKVVLGKDGITTGAIAQVDNNKVYDIKLGIAGPGQDITGGGKANVIVTATAAHWAAKVTQSPVIK